jgi:hypothetical protein
VNPGALTIDSAPAANDNAYSTGRPLVRAARGRANATYACSDNVILPLKFAQRMTGWADVAIAGGTRSR